MLLPLDPIDGVATGYAYKWTREGGRFILDLLVGNTATPAAMKVALLVGEPTFNEFFVVDSTALAEVELIDYPTSPRHADGYLQGDLLLPGFTASTGAAMTLSGDSVGFGSNSSASVAWPTVTHIALLKADGTVMASVRLDTPITVAAGFEPRIPVGSFTFNVAAGVGAA